MCTLHVTTREKGGCVDMIGGVERASECIEFKEKWNSSRETGFDQVKVPYHIETLMRVEEGEERRRAAVL